MCPAIEKVARKPAYGKRWRVASTKQHCNGPHHIVHGRAVDCGDAVFVEPAAVGRGEPCLVDFDLDGDRRAGQGTGVVSAAQHRVQPVGLLSHQIGSAVDDPR
jgi:hypothetical protein